MVMENCILPLSSAINDFKFITTQSVDRQHLVDLVEVIVNILDNIVVVVVVGVVVGKMKKTSSILRRISFRNGKQDDDAKKESGILLS